MQMERFIGWIHKGLARGSVSRRPELVFVQDFQVGVKRLHLEVVILLEPVFGAVLGAVDRFHGRGGGFVGGAGGGSNFFLLFTAGRKRADHKRGNQQQSYDPEFFHHV